MPSRILLRLDDDGLSAWSWQRKRLLALAEFADDPTGHLAFAALLARHRGAWLSLLADLADETLLSIEIPRLGRRDRAALLARRLAQHFPDTPLRCAGPAGRTAAGGEILALHAIASPQRLAPWLAAIVDAGCELTRLHTAGQLAGPLLAQHIPGQRAALLIVCHARRFRISALVAGTPTFSRLRPYGEQAVATLASEAEGLRDYLLGRLPHLTEQILPVVVIAPTALLEELAGHWPGGGRLALHPIAADGRTLELQMLAGRPPRSGMLLAGPPQGCVAAHLDRLLLIGGSVALAAALAFAGERQAHADRLAAETRALIDEGAQLGARRPSEAAASPPMSAATLKELGTTLGELANRRQLPGPSWRRLAHFLERQPTVAVARLDWKILPAPGMTAENLPPAVETLTLFGRLDGPPEEFAALLAALRADPLAELTVVQTPTHDGGATDGEFALEIRRRLLP